jgi:hypothetical protein
MPASAIVELTENNQPVCLDAKCIRELNWPVASVEALRTLYVLRLPAVAAGEFTSFRVTRNLAGCKFTNRERQRYIRRQLAGLGEER